MIVTRKSLMSGITRSIDLPITEDQIANYLAGAHVQNAFPNLPAADREFIMTGIIAEEWDEIFSEED